MLGTIHVIHGFQPLLLVLISIVIFLCRCYFSYHFLSTCGSDSKESACNAGDPGLIPELGRSPGEGNGNPVQYPLPGESHGQRSLAGYNPWGHKELEMTEINEYSFIRKDLQVESHYTQSTSKNFLVFTIFKVDKDM